MDRYDPELAPDSREWLALDEGELVLLVEEYHRDARITEHIYDLLHTKSLPAGGHAPYYAALQQLTVEKWRGG